MQAAQDIAHHRAADPKIVAEFGFDDAELAENQAGGNLLFHLVIDQFPGAAALQRLVDLNGDLQVELADVLAQRFDVFARRPDQKAAAGKTVDQIFVFENSQRRLHRRAARLHEFGNRTLPAARSPAADAPTGC